MNNWRIHREVWSEGNLVEKELVHVAATHEEARQYILDRMRSGEGKQLVITHPKVTSS